MSLARNIGDLPNGDDAPVFACRAWINFNGTGTIAIRDSGNVTSITDNGTGDYTVTFATAMPDLNYAVCGACGRDGSRTDNLNTTSISTDVYSTSSIRVLSVYEYQPEKRDSQFINVAIFR